jgi:hypothetical protein
MRQFGKGDVPQGAFIAALKMDSDWCRLGLRRHIGYADISQVWKPDLRFARAGARQQFRAQHSTGPRNDGRCGEINFGGRPARNPMVQSIQQKLALHIRFSSRVQG